MADLVTQAEYARRRGVSRAAVSKAVDTKRITLINGMIDVEVADIQWSRNTHPEQAARANSGKGRGEPDAPDGEVIEYWAMKARREKAETLKVEMQLAEMSGRLVSRDKVESAAYQAGRLLRDMILSVPGKLAGELAVVSDPLKVEIRMREELRKVLSEIARLTRAIGEGHATDN